jgi:NADH:ubiquinone oxidoreductase subunit 3 (subunit A)
MINAMCVCVFVCVCVCVCVFVCVCVNLHPLAGEKAKNSSFNTGMALQKNKQKTIS